MSRRQQLYGKRSRATYDPFAIFASPQRPAAVKTEGEVEVKVKVDVMQLVDQVEELRLYHGARDGRGSSRLALGERSPNAGTNKPLVVGEEKKGRRRRAKRVVEEKEDDEAAAEEQMVQQNVMAVGTEPCHEEKDCENNVKHEVSHEAQDWAELVKIDTRLEEETSTGRGAIIKTAEEHEQARTPEPAPRAVALPHTTGSVVLEAGPQTPCITIVPPALEEPDIHTQHCSSLLDLSLHPLTSFSEWSNQLSAHFSLTKIAEASFGEVYRLSLLEQLPGFSHSDESVFKVIALTPPEAALPKDNKKKKVALKKAEAMSKPNDVANEVRLLQRMSSTPGFTNFRDVRILRGRPGQPFVSAFKQFNAEQKVAKKDLSIFPDPAKKTSYGEDQLWAVIEMQDAGTDLERLVERGECTSIWSVWDVFWQVVLTLAKGEEGAQFEHRDLHLGNICVRSSLSASPSSSASSVKEVQTSDAKRKLGFTHLETTVIDYTISRCQLPTSTSSPSSTNIAYHDLSTLSDTSLFEGDSTEEYQYDIYRYMRGALLLDNPLADFSSTQIITAAAESGRSWSEYHPVTNLVWLHFVLYKLLEQVDWPSAVKAPPKKRKEEHSTWKRANDLEHKLLKVQSLLDPELLCQGELRSASDIVGLALTEGWLDAQDVMGEDGEDEDASVEVESDLVEDFTHLQIKVDVMEEHGLEVAEKEAKAVQRRTRRK